MINKDVILALLVSLFLLWGDASATEVEGLYAVEVPVAGQETAQRNQAIRNAFGLMLVKVTGNRSIAGRSELADAISKAPRYVQQYQYRLVPVAGATEPPVSDPESEGFEPKRLLSVAFDRNAVGRLLRERRLPVWEGSRPSALVWIGIEKGGQRRLGLPDGDGYLYKALSRASARRGIPIVFPLMDLEDQAGMQIADLWGDFETRIRQASDRYSPDLIVNGRISRVSNRLWRAQWSFFLGDQVVKWSDEGKAASLIADRGVERVADLLAKRFAPVGGDSDLSQAMLRVEGVNGYQGFLAVSNFLGTQGVVENADPVFVEPGTVTFALKVRGGIDVLERSLLLGGLLQPVSEGVDDEFTGPVDMVYRLK